MISFPDEKAALRPGTPDSNEMRIGREHANYLEPSALAWAERVLERIGPRRGRRPLEDMSRSLLLLVDVQRLFVDPASPAFLPSWPRAESTLRSVLETARGLGVPVAWSRHVHPRRDQGGSIRHFFGRTITKDSAWAELAPWLERRPGELVFDKARHPAFLGTDLADTMADLGRDSIVLLGVQAPLCVTATAVWAGALDFVPVVVADGLAAKTEDEHESALVTLASGLAHVVTSNELLAAWRDALRPGASLPPHRTK